MIGKFYYTYHNNVFLLSIQQPHIYTTNGPQLKE
ncbi:hypothetical protein SAMN06265374_3745 [Roseibium denhamense]|uniref:Uncharacterized protein n=1 Tax=Roseibium denhamense TaxID=76305 RepID=A0ABY1PGA2_9HYPH|nr:hypothetical protein SAMN06265374_3745 [Roseibium denhamense]